MSNVPVFAVFCNGLEIDRFCSFSAAFLAANYERAKRYYDVWVIVHVPTGDVVAVFEPGYYAQF